ncbi:MAG: Transposase mutator type [Thermoanaerobacterales bacterium 50_218]|nr:MAG: Transposase mutator type [Thermoanaerobacterales bacterium 50_218]
MAVWPNPFVRNILDACPKFLQRELHELLRLIFDAPDLATACRLMDEVFRDYADRAPKAVGGLEVGFEDAMTVVALPERYRKRLNQEIWRRERVIQIFPNEESALRLIGSVLMEIEVKNESASARKTTGKYHYRPIVAT